MSSFLISWEKSAITTLGLFWAAFWAFGLGYFISSLIQVFVTRERMKKTMGETEAKSVALATFFGFISSSCSFAALATTRALFVKGAGLVPSLAFLLASTNLVIELGIIISVFLSWHFVVGEYVGGLMLIAFMWILVRFTGSKSLNEDARKRAKQNHDDETEQHTDLEWKKLIQSKEGWIRVANNYIMEWKMVWKDVTIGFTVAGIIATFVPRTFFETLFIGSGLTHPDFWQVLLQAMVGPLAAFFTFIGSMGNIPLAAVLFENGVSYAGIMAFIFSDLVVFPVLRIQSKYYGWKMALYILGIFLLCLIVTSLALHYSLSSLGFLPQAKLASSVTERVFFKLNYTFVLNLVFLILTFTTLSIYVRKNRKENTNTSWGEKILLIAAIFALIWLAIGLLLKIVGLLGP